MPEHSNTKEKKPETVFKHKAADDSPGFLLWKMTSLWQQKLNEILEKLGINQTQYAILASLKWFEENKEPITQTHLVKHTKIEKMTVSKSVRDLEKKGFLARRESSTDNRAMLVTFTRKGYSTTNIAIVAVENADDEFFSCLNRSQLSDFKSIVGNVIRHRS